MFAHHTQGWMRKTKHAQDEQRMPKQTNQDEGNCRRAQAKAADVYQLPRNSVGAWDQGRVKRVASHFNLV